MSKMKALLAILLVGAFAASAAVAFHGGPHYHWVCHKGKPLLTRGPKDYKAHLGHGDTPPHSGARVCPPT